MLKFIAIILLGLSLVTACGNSQATPAHTATSVAAPTSTTRPATGPGSAQCVNVPGLPCPALPLGQHWDLNIGVSTVLTADNCPQGQTPSVVTLTAVLADGHENVSGHRQWCLAWDRLTVVPQDWAALFGEVLAQAR